MNKKPSSIFLSHNFKDKDFVRRLASDLSKFGINIWLDEAEIMIGDSLIEKIQHGISDMDFLGVILSPDSVNSNWVQKELEIALTMEINKKTVRVLPLLYKNCEIPNFLIGKAYADFTQPEFYRDSLFSLLRRLGIDNPQKSNKSHTNEVPGLDDKKSFDLRHNIDNPTNKLTHDNNNVDNAKQQLPYQQKVMNVQKIIVTCEAGKIAKKRIDKKMIDLQLEIKEKEEELKKLQHDIKEYSNNWSESKKSEKAREYQMKSKRLQIKIEENRNKLKQDQDIELKPILEALEKVVKTFRSENNYPTILDTKQVLAYDDSNDVTHEIIELLNAQIQ